MPYILKERREELEPLLKEMLKHNVEANGDINYLLFAYCKRNIKPSYNNYKNFIGELVETAAEIRRRFLAPYEDEKTKENGDVE